MRKWVVVVIIVAVGIWLWPSSEQESIKRRADSAALRTTAFGPVKGGQDIHDTFAWLGVPFAAPPVAGLRWRAPRPPIPWSAPREAINFREPCTQLAGPLDGTLEEGPVVGNEDCLYLNIWSPRSHSESNSDALPVMVWIHGGGNSVGTANTYSGALLAAEGQVVVVTINYRLGVLGWMSHPALRTPDRDLLDASGNYGNLDMIAALQWVKNNIGHFGGAADNVTIFGESAGGLNVYTLIASPMANGLFHKAISQSGMVSTTPQWRAENFADDENPGHALSSREWLSGQLQYAGRAQDAKAAQAMQLLMTDEDVQEFMYSRSALQILQGLSGGAGMYFAPNSLRDGTVLPKETLFTLFDNPELYNNVPLITGTNRDEVKLFMAQDPVFVERRFGLLPRIRDLDAFNSTAAYGSDNWKALAVDESAARITDRGGKPVYAYRWDWDEGGKNFLVDFSTLLGASHGLEVPFVFGNFEGAIGVPGLYTEENIPGRDILASQMRSYWTQFAHTGAPGKGRRGDLHLWQPWGFSENNLMLLDTPSGGGLRMVEEPMTIAMLKERVARDKSITDLRERCSLYVEMFLLPNSGDDTWDEESYTALGCGLFEPWSLENRG